MSFFDVPPPPPPQPPPEEVRPAWAGPPDAVIPVCSKQRAVLLEGDHVLFVAHRFFAYPTGLMFSLSLWVRGVEVQEHPFEARHQPAPLSDDFLRFGVSFADGSKWTNLDWRLPGSKETPAGPVVMARGGSGRRGAFNSDYWMWPLPPEDTLTFAASWPRQGFAEQFVDLDAAELRERATEAVALWPET